MPLPAPVPENMAPKFSLQGISFTVTGRTILQPLDLDLPTGKTIGLIGHNGSGKSTLVRLLARQIRPSTGQILFDGRRLEAWSNRDFARSLAYLPQQTPVPAGTSVRELVKFGRYPWHGPLGAFGRLDEEKVAEALELTRTMTLADRSVETLSGGEQQRAWIAALVAQDTKCLLLDEPISALDIAHQIAVLDLVQKLTKARELSVVMVLHDINMASRYCDEIIALRDGSLIARGSPREVMTTEYLKHIYGVEFTIHHATDDGRPSALLR
ncbi:ferrichrome ABC transporter nucleotide-binding protein/ATPase [Agrobacterium albertimagni AOL15]|uniref:Ferrichrome ABC transporter nucleotide-binding protein/ATPase n=1 Tax=Agrobacterium albertimagni AOL15 TaxID=1156935 RepID=K2PYS6_9HYPH|nr:ATP-binding cassette domain-containing protein [Agrobacterium albertimagni]EKF57920.1 ferrichrome ABC transporter nucleotide-binding protein/ATPase [Agrobacterium albertimagni AOL15]